LKRKYNQQLFRKLQELVIDKRHNGFKSKSLLSKDVDFLLQYCYMLESQLKAMKMKELIHDKK